MFLKNNDETKFKQLEVNLTESENNLASLKYKILSLNTSDNIDENIVGFIKQYYSSTFDIPKEIVIQDKLVAQSDINSWF